MTPSPDKQEGTARQVLEYACELTNDWSTSFNQMLEKFEPWFNARFVPLSPLLRKAELVDKMADCLDFATRLGTNEVLPGDLTLKGWDECLTYYRKITDAAHREESKEGNGLSLKAQVEVEKFHRGDKTE